MPIKKILIERSQDSALAKEALEKELVDVSVQIEDSNFLTLVGEALHQFDWKYFVNVSKPVFDLPSHDFGVDLSSLKIDRDFIYEDPKI